MKTLKYIVWAGVSLALVLLVSLNARHSKPRLAQVDMGFDETAVC